MFVEAESMLRVYARHIRICHCSVQKFGFAAWGLKLWMRGFQGWQEVHGFPSEELPLFSPTKVLGLGFRV